MGWKSLKYIFVPSAGPVNRIQLIAVLPAEAVLGYLDLKSESRKTGSDISSLPQVDEVAFSLFYEPKTSSDWYALVNLCQKLAARDSIIAAVVGREYVRIKIGTSVIRIRVSRTHAPREVHVNQGMYYVSYEGEYDPVAHTIARGSTDHGFMAGGAPLPPTYPMVAQFIQDHPTAVNGPLMRAALRGVSDAPRTEMKTATVAAFLAEGARNVRALPLNLMMLDLVEQGVNYSTGSGRERTFSMNRMFWRQFEYSEPSARVRQTAGGHMPQSGAGGADVKKVKMIQPPISRGPAPPPHWVHRTGFAPHPAQPKPALGLAPYQTPVFTPSTFAVAQASLSAMARPAVDKECGLICKWLSHKFNLLAEERMPAAVMGSVRFLPITNLSAISFAGLAVPPTETAQIAGLMRKMEIIKAALDDRISSLANLLIARQDLS
jgi:hypothetical protein